LELVYIWGLNYKTINMKYSERFFKFPIRIYDRFSIMKSEEIEKSTDTPHEGEWLQGFTRIPYNQITSWHDFYDSVQGVDGAREDGFEATLVYTQTEGTFICTLDRETFEQSLNEFVEKYDAWVQSRVDQLNKDVNMQL